MADKKIIQLDPAGPITANDIIPICQDLASGELLYLPAGNLRTYVLGGANAGARIYFNVGPPVGDQGVEGDVAFDVQAHAIYQKVSGEWTFQDNYGSIGGTGVVRFSAAYDSGGLSADGLMYTDPGLVDKMPTQVMIEADALIMVQELGAGLSPAYDEWDFDINTGTVIFGSAVPEGARVTIMYAY